MRCPRCPGGQVVAVLRVPRRWVNAAGRPVRGLAEVLVCERCDAGDPLVDHLTRHPAPDGDDLAPLLRHWTARIPDDAALRAETDAWHRGDL